MASQVSNGALRAALSVAAAPCLTDRELLNQFSAGDQAAFAAIVKRHTGLVLGVCRRVLPTVQDAEDACQAVFLVLARKAKTGGWQSSIANWLYTAARRIASETNRAASRRIKREAHAAPPAPVSALDEMTGREAFAALDEELDKLPAIYREPLVLCYLQGLTRDEAANRLGVPFATLKSQLDRGRKKLADALTKRGIDIGAGLIAVAATSSARASSRLVESILATIGGTPSTSVAAIAQATSVNGLALKAKLLALAAITVIGTGFGHTSLQILARSQNPAIQTTKQPATKDDAKRNDNANSDQPVAKTDEPPNFKPIDPETIAAYEKLGAKFGGFYGDRFEFDHFVPGTTAAAKGLPGFYFDSLRDGMLPKLPPVQVSFGLEIAIGSRAITDAGLKELRDLKNLTVLSFFGMKGAVDGLKHIKNWIKSNATFVGTTVTDAGIKELKNLRSLTTLRLDNTQVTDAGLKELKELKNLTALGLFNTKVTDAGLNELKDLKNLSTLGLDFTKVTDAGLRELMGLENLRMLDLSGTMVTGAGLKDLKNLSALDLGDTKATDAGLKGLKNLKNLAKLDLNGTLVTDAGLKELADLKNLASLNLAGTPVTGAGLKQLKNLAVLNLFRTKVTDAELKELADLKNLTTLDLRNTQATGAGLKQLKNLTTLKFANEHITDTDLKELTELKKLASLDLGGTQVTDAGLKELKHFKNLTFLELLGNTQVTDAGLKELKELKNLTFLDLGGTQVTGVGLKDLNNLTVLGLGWTQVTDAGLKELKDQRNLTALGLANTRVTDAGLKELKELKNLNSLNLWGTRITDAGLKELKNLKNLRTLFLDDTAVTKAGLIELREALPRCEIDR